MSNVKSEKPKGRLKVLLPAILVILFEIFVGVMLLINPEGFTKVVIIILGALLLLLAVVFLVNFIRSKRDEEAGTGALVGAIICFIVGLLCVIFSQGVLGVLESLAIIYGIILFVFGLNKIIMFFATRNEGYSASWFHIVGGIIALALGVVIFLYPRDATITVWVITGIALLAEAVIDIISVIHTAVLMKKVNF
ncbi:MAG: DUF308 domain-containing protein [Ruminococcus sp.]|nr:DUF308 domain-containing protein [Ruminococcus sp.]